MEHVISLYWQRYQRSHIKNTLNALDIPTVTHPYGSIDITRYPTTPCTTKRGPILHLTIFGTKRFEQIVRLPLGEVVAWIESNPDHQRGEFVLLLSGAAEQTADGVSAEAQRVLQLLLAELPLKSAARLCADITGEAKNALYELGLSLKDRA